MSGGEGGEEGVGGGGGGIASKPPGARFGAKNKVSPLPISWEQRTMTRQQVGSALELGGIGGDKPDDDGEGDVVVYQRYSLPADTKIRDWRDFRFEQKFALGPLTLQRPKPPPLFHMDHRIVQHLSHHTSLDAHALSKGKAAGPVSHASKAFQAFRDRCTMLELGVHRMAQLFFTKSDEVDRERFVEAENLCLQIFGRCTLSSEEVQVFGPHERSLKEEGESKDWFLSNPNTGINSLYMRECDKLSLMCAVQDWSQAPNGTLKQYPEREWGICESIFGGKDALSEEGGIFQAATLVVDAVCRGPWAKNRSGCCVEKDGLEGLINLEVPPLENSKKSGGRAQGGEASCKLLKIAEKHKEGGTVLVDGQEVKLGAVGITLCTMSLTEFQDVVMRFKARVPSRGRQPVTFPTLHQQALRERAAQRSRRPMSGKLAKMQKTNGFREGWGAAWLVANPMLEGLIGEMPKAALRQAAPAVLGRELTSLEGQKAVGELREVFLERVQGCADEALAKNAYLKAQTEGDGEEGEGEPGW